MKNSCVVVYEGWVKFASSEVGDLNIEPFYPIILGESQVKCWFHKISGHKNSRVSHGSATSFATTDPQTATTGTECKLIVQKLVTTRLRLLVTNF